MNFQNLNQMIIKWFNHFIKIGERSIFLKNVNEIDINTLGNVLIWMVPFVISKS